jgi:chitinase
LHGAGGAFDSDLQSNIQTLQNAGKNVLISVGSHQARSITNQKERLSTLGMLIAGVSDFGGGEAFACQVAAKTKRGAE